MTRGRRRVRLFQSIACVALGVCAATGAPAPITVGQTGTKSTSSAAGAPYYWSWWGWEPIEHNIRFGGPSYTVDGGSWWAPKWYDRLHREELVQKMSGLGINLAVTHFFKGFGLKSERPQWERTGALVRLAHGHGVKVLGYCQLGSLYYETFLAEEPGAEAWALRTIDGSLKPYEGAQYYRWRPCINHPEFRAYIKRAVSIGLGEVGLDGFNFDNCSNPACYCDHCTALFRAWLGRRYREPLPLFGINSFDHVRQPPAPAKADQVHDPLVRAWIRWRCEALAAFLGEVAGHARGLKADAILMANPSHPCGASDTALRGVWPVWLGRHLDLMIAENANEPEVAGDLMVSQIRAHKNAAAVGYRAVPTTWAEGPGRLGAADASVRLAQTPSAIRLQIAEAAANGGIPGSNWATRPLGGGDGMRIDRPEFAAALDQYLGFVRKHKDLIFSGRPLGDVAVLHAFPSLAFNGQHAMDQIAAAEEVLIRAGLQWGVVFDDNLDRLENFSVLILAGQTHLSDAACDAVRRFVHGGGAVVMLGENGRYDDEGRLLQADRLAGLSGDRVSRLEAGAITRIKDRRWGVFAALIPTWKDVVAAILKEAEARLSARILDPDTRVSLSASQGNDGKLVVQLVNYAGSRSARNHRIAIGTTWGERGAARLLTPEKPERMLEVRRDGARYVIEVPPIDVYGVVLVE